MAIKDLISQAQKSKLGKAISNVVSRADRDKSMAGFQIVPGGISGGVDRVRQSFKTDPGQYSITRGFSNIVPTTQAVLSPINFLKRQAPSQFAQDVSYGLRGASQLTPFQAINSLGLDRTGQKQYQSTTPTTNRQRQAQQIGRSTYGLALTAPLGGANMARNVAGRAVTGTLAGAGLGAGISKVTGGSAIEGAKQGALSGYSFAPLGAITNPLTQKALAGVPSILQNQVGQRAIGGVANLIEDEIQGLIDGYDTDTKSRVTSLVLGAVLTGNEDALKSVRTQLSSMGIKNADDIITKAKSRLPEGARNLKFEMGGQEYDKVMSKSDASDWTAYLQSKGIKYELTNLGQQGGYAQFGDNPKPPTDPLIQEAKKYGSAEEFYNAKGMSDEFRNAGIRGSEQFTNFWEKATKEMDKNPVLNSLNPTGGVLVDYNPKSRATMKLGDNMTTFAKTSGIDPDELVTIYRGAPTSQKKIVPGDFITTNPELAKSYGENVIKMRVKASDILDDITEPLGDEYLYRPGAGKEIYNQATKQETITNIFGQEVPVTKESGLIDFGAKIEPFDSQKYIREQTAKQHGIPTKKSLAIGIDQTLQAIKTKFEDFTTPIETAISKAEKSGKYKILPKDDIRYQIDKVLRADSLGTQFIKDNGLEAVIRDTDSLDNLNQYLIAKQATDVSIKGVETGRNLSKDQQLIQTLGSRYEPIAQQIYSYNAKLRDYLVESGLISKDLAETLAKEYPNYVPLKRIFTETEQQALRQVSGRGGPASIGLQNVVKKLKGSKRDISNPLESLLENTGLAFREGERNKGARMLVDYIKNDIIPGKEIKGNIGAKHTISFLDNGRKRVFEVSPEIATAAKNLNADQLSRALQIVAIPTRVLQMGATGLNVPFIVGNLVKDQVTASVISKAPLSTSIANPINFVKAFFSSVKKDALYDSWVRSGSSFTSFDISRGSAPNTISGIRSNRSVPSKVKYLVTNPSQLFRALENIIGTTENLTRIQQYSGTKQALLKQGRTALDADILGASASRTNTANFARKGEFGKVLNAVIPFFNAGIQGARSLRNSFTSDPKGTSLRFVATIGVPIATATLWNNANYERKFAYEDIPDYEKENNIIILPEKPVKDADGNYNAIKIPVTPGMSNLMSIIRRQVEGVVVNPQEALKVLSDLTAAGTSFEIPIDADSTRQLVSQVTPQGLKIPLEQTLNKNFFTGKDIVPQYMTKLPPEEQVRDNTSGTARIIGSKINTSPLKVENLISSTTAGTGRQLLNLSDKILANKGIIPEEQVGGRSIADDVEKRFIRVSGNDKVNKLYEQGLNTKQIEKLLEEEKANTAKFSGSREKSPEAPKTIMGKISLAAQGLTKDPKNTIKAIFTEEVMRKITNDTLIFERKTNINPGKEGYHVDHTIPLSLGGDNSPENLVVYEKEAKAKKDILEAKLWRQLDNGEITDKEARKQIQSFIDSNGIGQPIAGTSKEYVKNIASGSKTTSTDLSNTISLPSTNKYEKSIRDSKLFSKLSSIESSKTITDAEKQSSKTIIARELGLTTNDLDNYMVAKEDNNVKTLHVLDQVETMQSPDEILQFLVKGRKPVNGKILTSDGVIDNLVDDGIIPYQLGKDLKKLDFNDDGTTKTKKTSSGSKGGSKSKKDPYATAYKNYLANLANISLPSGKIRTQAPIKVSVKGLTFAD